MRSFFHLWVLLFSIGGISAVAAPRTSRVATDLRAAQHRHPTQDYKDSFKKYFLRLNLKEQRQWRRTESPVSAAVAWKQWKGLAGVPKMTLTDLERSFNLIRDSRYLESTQGPKFLRRNSWLYPDDGCWSRASFMKDNIEKLALPTPRKVFAFGNLSVSTANSPAGSVSWWYHVVPLVQVAGVPYVYDPAIEPKHPLTLVQWIERMGGTAAEIKIADCDPKTFSPSSSCDAPNPEDEKTALEVQKRYLEAEWERVVQLGRDPVRELGDNPPWPIDYRERRRNRPRPRAMRSTLGFSP